MSRHVRREARRGFLRALYETIAAGIGRPGPAFPRAARGDEELAEAFAVWKRVGLHGSVGLALYRRDERGAYAFSRMASQGEDDAFVRLHHTTLAAVLAWRGAAEAAAAKLERLQRLALEAADAADALPAPGDGRLRAATAALRAAAAGGPP